MIFCHKEDLIESQGMTDFMMYVWEPFATTQTDLTAGKQPYRFTVKEMLL